MACQAMHSWTFTGLVGAFLDLSIAYLLLCASTLAYFASKFLGLFGLCLPCPCNGLFGIPNSNNCLQKRIVDCPVERISSVQLSVKGKFPFDSILAEDRDYQLNLKLSGERNNNLVDGLVEMEGEASSSSKLENVLEKDFALRGESVGEFDVKEEKVDLKCEGTVNRRPRSELRRRRKDLSDYAKVWSVSSLDASLAESPSSINYKGNEVIGCSPLAEDSGAGANLLNFEKASLIRYLRERASYGFDFNEPIHEHNPGEKNESSDDRESNVQKELGYDGNEKNAIRILELALEEERAACAGLYLELEKERSAAASAADEAMAMILRLQEEKASIEMEARQYQRMIEEKSAYDAEEMNLLKEILVRREREKHFLEKEVEAYRQMICSGNQQLNTEEREELASSLGLGDDPVMMLQQLSESIDRKEFVKDKVSVNELASINKLDPDKEFSHIPGSYDEHDFAGKTISHDSGSREQSYNADEQKVAEECIETHKESDLHITYEGDKLEQHEEDAYKGSKNSENLALDVEPRVHDVHVIDGEFKGNKNESLVGPKVSNVSEIQRTDVMADFPRTRSETKLDIDRSRSDMSVGRPPLGSSAGKSVISKLRRNSMSAVDNERLRIDSEVGWLRERLKVVQEGRERLNLSVDHRDREKFEVQLLEDIVCQLREIRKLTEPGKAARQASLPLPSSKAMSKKRRHRSASLGVHKSS